MSVDYTVLPGFSSYLLEDSFVLGISVTPGQVLFECDLVLTSSHEDYTQPPAWEAYCYRKGRITFAGVSRVEWRNQGARPAVDASGEEDYGNIDSLSFDASLSELEGGWGVMTVASQSVGILLDAN